MTMKQIASAAGPNAIGLSPQRLWARPGESSESNPSQFRIFDLPGKTQSRKR